jgi:hypothetical protein
MKCLKLIVVLKARSPDSVLRVDLTASMTLS